MDITTLLSPDTVICQHTSSSKKRMLEDIAERMSEQFPNLSANTIFSALIARERLGSTGIGNGIAIPHCRIADCKETAAMLITLSKGIDFDAIDSQNVDIIFVLLVPENTNDNHLKTLASIAEKFSNDSVLQQVRNAKDSDALLQAIAL